MPYEYYRPYNGKSLNQMPIVDFDSLKSMTEKVKAKVSNFTCVLRKLEVIDSNYNVNTAKLVQQTLSYPVSHSLKHDLVKRIEHCNQMVNCMPIENTESPVPGTLQKLLAYLGCEKKLRLLACMKEDLRRNIGDYDLSGFPFQASENERINKLLFVLWGAESSDFELQ
ncbi:unnamed protein product [Meganyctiphanes norvegica]|uniref:Uncharacterized protein n=1 Tax=Meganyctiphanes norvegica TaxID=48144 RepID=A0AAV2PL06_MEGNR